MYCQNETGGSFTSIPIFVVVVVFIILTGKKPFSCKHKN
jgi:hypothetical protein